MEKFVGTWQQTGAENLEAFLKATNVPQDRIQQTVSLLSSPGLCETIAVSGTEVTITQGTAGSNKQVKKGILGQEVDFTYLSGQSCKMTFTLEGEDLVEIMAGQHHTRTVRKISGSTLTQTMTVNDVTATRTFTKL